MMQDQATGSFVTGKMWNYRSEASLDLDMIYELLYDIPRCDTKKELIDILRRTRSKIEIMMDEIKKPGTAYSLKDVEL